MEVLLLLLLLLALSLPFPSPGVSLAPADLFTPSVPQVADLHADVACSQYSRLLFLFFIVVDDDRFYSVWYVSLCVCVCVCRESVQTHTDTHDFKDALLIHRAGTMEWLYRQGET